MRRISPLFVFAAVAPIAHAAAPATYDVTLTATSPPRFSVTATIPDGGEALAMSTTRPGDIPAVDSRGWPALVRGLRATDDGGHAVAVEQQTPGGWHLVRRVGRLHLRYEVDYSPLGELGWPAQREAAFADAHHVVVAGRSLFITSKDASDAIRVTIHAPPGWRAIGPWVRTSDGTFSVATRDDLTDNLLALSDQPAAAVRAGEFTVSLVATGWWQPVGRDARAVLKAVTPRLVRLIGARERAQYVVVLLPAKENGGESFRSSFAMTTEEQPTRANRPRWANTIAHEVFHYWNGWRLRGVDYAASQWFQEGFTEYAANIATVAAGVTTESQFRDKLAEHIRNSARLTTTLEAPGTRKGPPLYSSGALVAFSWDVLIRRATSGKRSVADVFRHLWRDTDSGRQPYEWAHIKRALQETTTGVDWDAYYDRHIRGHEPLPVAEALALAGLQLTGTAGSPQVNVDPGAGKDARERSATLIRQRAGVRAR